MADDSAPIRPEGEYAIVEVLGHRTIIGRVSEVQRFGATLLAIEPIWEGALLPAVLVGGGSIYQLTSCSADVAFERAPRHYHQLPPSVAATVPRPAATALLTSEDEHDGPFAPDFLGERLG